MKLRLIILALLVAIVSAACQPPPELRNPEFLTDDSLLTGEPCEAPCWRGIVPGETSWRDARIIVEDDPQLVEPTVNETEDGGQVLVFQDDDGPQCCQVYTQDGETVTQILTLLAPNITLGEVIERYGEPEYMSGADVTSDQTLVLIIFPDVPLGLYAFGSGVETGELTPESEIIGAIYLDPADMDELLNTDLYYWEGYGPLAEMLDGEFDIVGETVDGEGDSGDVIEEIDIPADDDGSTADESADAEATPESTETEDAASSEG
ncbi:hypothetical protein G4Y79_17335 [Phototrophicus methaneseepsis]|uniref:Uncharacterized protein n=1 Tax=Phototrophicus methaneseepsis TaxID=2710758 RepID=A0A7S8E6U4_9CHLR|nr:hypothetical protein [Phototrophicus methaneseepsis]QPC81445.1 hypothetical protein G4Y79_17335 [Phototrophicus methaneseepsis]